MLRDESVARPTRPARVVCTALRGVEMVRTIDLVVRTLLAVGCIVVASCGRLGFDGLEQGGGLADSSGDARSGDAASDGLALSRSAQYQAAVLADGPTAYWRLTDPECALTQCANSARAEYAATPPPMLQLVDGIFTGESRAASFDATHTESLISADLPFSQGSFSVELWYRVSQAPVGYGALVFQSNGPTTNADIFIVYHHTQYGLVFERRSSTLQQKLTVAYAGALGATWHHVVATYAPPTALALYVDGVASTTLNMQANQGEPVSPFAIGGWGTSFSGGELNGSIAEVAFYPTVVSPVRVQDHYSLGRPGL